jgi:Domain of unknown function (DUF4430)
MANLIKVFIYADPDASNPTLSLPDVPWYAGVTVLQAMIIGEAMHVQNFSFRVEYRSIYGAQIDSIDGISDGDKPNHYWLLYVNGEESQVGASEAILLEDLNNQTAVVEWRYLDVSSMPHPAAERKTATI